MRQGVSQTFFKTDWGCATHSSGYGHSKTRNANNKRGASHFLLEYSYSSKKQKVIAQSEQFKHIVVESMTPEEKQKVPEHLREVAKILQKNTPVEQQQDFESLELSVREHLLETVAPEISDFF